ncbi:hypothetical protein RCH05_004105 [Janthinobacterium sp. CAN_S7]
MFHMEAQFSAVKPEKIMLTYVIREVNSKKMVSCWEGIDGKIRAAELTEIHNKYLTVKWFVSEEIF